MGNRTFSVNKVLELLSNLTSRQDESQKGTTLQKIAESVQVFEAIFDQYYGECRLQIVHASIGDYKLVLIPSMAGKTWFIQCRFGEASKYWHLIIDTDLVEKARSQDLEVFLNIASQLRVAIRKLPNDTNSR